MSRDVKNYNSILVVQHDLSKNKDKNKFNARKVEELKAKTLTILSRKVNSDRRSKTVRKTLILPPRHNYSLDLDK